MAGDDFGIPGHESRPNLLVAVFAPEDVQSASHPFPLPPEKRILYVSAAPRMAAGIQEAFVIRLLQEQIDQFGISQPNGTPTSDVSVSRLHSATTQAIALRDGVRKKLGPSLRAEQQQAHRIRKIAAEKVKSMSAIPLHLRDGKLQNNKFLLFHRSELPTRLKVVQDEAIADGLKRIRKVTPTLRLRLSAQDLKDLGLRDGKEQKIDTKKLLAKTKELLGGADIVRRSIPSNALADSLQTRYLSPSKAKGDSNSEAPTTKKSGNDKHKSTGRE
jgi:hypothetical protein